MKLSVLREISRLFSAPTTPEEVQTIREYLQNNGMEYSNFYQELEMSNPMVETHRDESSSNTMMSLHSHDFYEMLFCRESEGVEYLVGTERYRLQYGDIVIVCPGVSHRPLLPEGKQTLYKREIIWFSKGFLEHMQTMLPSQQLELPMRDMLFLRTKDTKWEFLGDMFRSGVTEAERGKPESDGIVLGNTIVILSCIARALGVIEGEQPLAEKPELLEQVMAYIERNIGEHITLEETAKHFYVSVSTITQLFRHKMGISFYRCVTQRRLIAAKTLIQYGQTLEDVSRAVGFTDYSSFYRAFKKEFGITPRQYSRL